MLEVLKLAAADKAKVRILCNENIHRLKGEAMGKLKVPTNYANFVGIFQKPQNR